MPYGTLEEVARVAKETVQIILQRAGNTIWGQHENIFEFELSTNGDVYIIYLHLLTDVAFSKFALIPIELHSTRVLEPNDWERV